MVSRYQALSLFRSFCSFLMTLALRIRGTKLLALSPAIPLAIVAHNFGFGATWVFALSIVGLASLAELVDVLRLQVAYHTSPTVLPLRYNQQSECTIWVCKFKCVNGFSLLNATIGNVSSEFIMAMFALYNHKVDVVKYLFLGSLTSNLLLLLGVSIYHGGIIKLGELQKYNKRQANVNSCMLLLASLCHLLPMAFRNVGASAAQAEELSLPLSIAGSITMLIVYFGKLVFQLRRPDSQSYEALDETKVIGLRSGIVWLAVTIALMALLSKYVVETIEEASNAWVLSVSFLSVTLLPTVGNVARYSGAITSASKDKLLDISLNVALDFATQIFMLMVPLCVTIAWLMGIKMDLNLPGSGFLTFTIIATVFPLKGWMPSFPFGWNSNRFIIYLRSSFSFEFGFN